MADDELHAAWDAVHAATPPAGTSGARATIPSGGNGVMYAFHPSEPPKVGHRSREWTAISESEIEVVREMARCLREHS